MPDATYAVFGLMMVLAGPASAQMADFARVTDTVRLTHDVPSSSLLTMEARVWLSGGVVPLGAIWREQKNSLEHREFAMSGDRVLMYLAAVSDVSYVGPIPTNRWVHVVCQQDLGRARIWVDGELKTDVATLTGPIAAVHGSSNSLGAGLQNDFAVVPTALIKIDWIRISTCSRYTGSLISEPHECSLLEGDPCTALLFTFDEASNSTQLINRGVVSGMAQVGAAWIPGATPPLLQGASADSDGDGVSDACEVFACPGDVDESGTVDAIDLAIVLQNWGAPNPKYPEADANGDGAVDGADLAVVLFGWGDCP